MFPLGDQIIGESRKKEFIALFGRLLRLRNILTAFDDFAGHEILSEREFQDYQSLYLNLYAEFRATSAAEKESINDDVVFEIDVVGARAIRGRCREAIAVFVDAPSRAVQRERMEARGDQPERIQRRIDKAEEEAARAPRGG